MKGITNLLVVIALFSEPSFSQEKFNKNDFVVGSVSIDKQIDSVLESIGKPARIDTIDVFDTADFLVYYFDGLTAWVEKSSHLISSFDISNQKFKTQRGLKVRDSTAKLRKLYGRGNTEKQLNRLYDIYDVSFKDFTEIVLYEYDPSENDALYIVFYVKNSRITKIYLYRGLGC